MKFTIATILLLINSHVYSQIKIPDHLGGFFIYKVSKDRIVKKLKEFEKYSPEELDTVSKWTYHLTVSSCKLYLGMDSSLYHFYEAYKIKPKATCETMRVRHDHFIKALKESKETGINDGYVEIIKKETGASTFSWYLWDLPNFDEFAFIDSCNLRFPPIYVEAKVRDSTQNSEIIRRRDQKFRSIGKQKEQQELDQINRDFIDSLYLSKGSLNAFNEEEIYQFSMVAHHSEDCDWTYKWIERLIDLSNGGYKGNTMLGPLLDRMLHPKDGYCSKQDLIKRDDFISMLKNKYPIFFEKHKLSW